MSYCDFVTLYEVHGKTLERGSVRKSNTWLEYFSDKRTDIWVYKLFEVDFQFKTLFDRFYDSMIRKTANAFALNMPIVSSNTRKHLYKHSKRQNHNDIP